MQAIAKTREGEDEDPGRDFAEHDNVTQIVSSGDVRYSQVIAATAAMTPKAEPTPPRVPVARGTPLPTSVNPRGSLQMAAAAALAEEDDIEIVSEDVEVEQQDVVVAAHVARTPVADARSPRRLLMWIAVGTVLGGGIVAALAALIQLS